jgi:hypothetical protein
LKTGFGRFPGKGVAMYNRAELCEKIRNIYPDIGACGIDVDVDYDTDQDSWVVYLDKRGRRIKHFLSELDADACMIGKQCVSLGIEIGQFRS